MQADGKWIKKRYEVLKTRRLLREPLWDYGREYLMPQKFDPLNKSIHDGTKERSLYDQTAIDSVETLANGHMSHVTPSGQRWFLFMAPEETRKYPEVRRFYSHASERMWKFLSKTNFYVVGRETYLERSGFGIGSRMCFEDPKRLLYFKNMECGTYVIDENHAGEVDTFIHEEEWEISKIKRVLGEAVFDGPMTKAWADFETKGVDRTFPLLWAVYPREEHDPTKYDVFSMPFASVFVCGREGRVLKEEGFMEFPGSVSRFLKGGGAGKEYGYGPMWRAFPSIKGANYLQMLMDYAGEKSLIPSLLVPEYLKGMVDSRAGGITLYKHGLGAEGVPRAWQDVGNYDIGVDRVEKRQEEIRRAFYVDMFRMFEGLDRQMTAYEVAQRAGEKLDQFGPTFLQQMHDDRSMMLRIFGILLRRGYFGDPRTDIPRRALVQQGGVWSVPDPDMVYTSRMALALNYVETSSIERQLSRATELAPVYPEVWDVFDVEAALRLMGQNDGAPEAIYRDENKVIEIRDARMAMQQQGQQLAAVEQMASAAGKVGVKVAS